MNKGTTHTRNVQKRADVCVTFFALFGKKELKINSSGLDKIIKIVYNKRWYDILAQFVLFSYK